ncbi:MAG: ATP-binding protein [Chloroflexi bacterium]|nr:ATP-binding protein [Chloroflexota bacterium]
MVDPLRMTQVFGNLVSNALRHTPSGGRVTLRTASAGPGVEFTVADTGEGIPSEQARARLRALLSWRGLAAARRRIRAGAGDCALAGRGAWRRDPRGEHARPRHAHDDHAGSTGFGFPLEPSRRRTARPCGHAILRASSGPLVGNTAVCPPRRKACRPLKKPRSRRANGARRQRDVADDRCRNTRRYGDFADADRRRHGAERRIA